MTYKGVLLDKDRNVRSLTYANLEMRSEIEVDRRDYTATCLCIPGSVLGIGYEEIPYEANK